MISESNLLFQLFRSIDRTWKRERSVGFDEITRGGRTGFFPSPQFPDDGKREESSCGEFELLGKKCSKGVEWV